MGAKIALPNHSFYGNRYPSQARVDAVEPWSNIDKTILIIIDSILSQPFRLLTHSRVCSQSHGAGVAGDRRGRRGRVSDAANWGVRGLPFRSRGPGLSAYRRSFSSTAFRVSQSDSCSGLSPCHGESSASKM